MSAAEVVIVAPVADEVVEAFGVLLPDGTLMRNPGRPQWPYIRAADDADLQRRRECPPGAVLVRVRAVVEVLGPEEPS